MAFPLLTHNFSKLLPLVHMLDSIELIHCQSISQIVGSFCKKGEAPCKGNGVHAALQIQSIWSLPKISIACHSSKVQCIKILHATIQSCCPLWIVQVLLFSWPHFLFYGHGITYSFSFEKNARPTLIARPRCAHTHDCRHVLQSTRTSNIKTIVQSQTVGMETVTLCTGPVTGSGINISISIHLPCRYFNFFIEFDKLELIAP